MSKVNRIPEGPPGQERVKLGELVVNDCMEGYFIFWGLDVRPTISTMFQVGLGQNSRQDWRQDDQETPKNDPQSYPQSYQPQSYLNCSKNDPQKSQKVPPIFGRIIEGRIKGRICPHQEKKKRRTPRPAPPCPLSTSILHGLIMKLFLLRRPHPTRSRDSCVVCYARPSQVTKTLGKTCQCHPLRTRTHPHDS